MAGYKVISQNQTVELRADGRFVDVMEVAFETETGSSGIVKVPLVGYSAETVQAAIQPLADHMVAIDKLGNE
jgi:hypothetical protein